MELNKEQIQELFKFTRQNQVVWYDLQSELVDHFASEIEHLWSKYPTITFNEAKEKAFEKFDKNGFKKVINANRKALNKRYNKLFLSEFIRFFTMPKMLLTIGLVGVVFLLVKILNHNAILLIVLPLSILFVFLYFAFKNQNLLKRKVKNLGKKYMFEDLMANLGNFVIFLNAPYQILAIYLIINKNYWSFTMEIIYSITIVIMALVFYVLAIVLPPKIRLIISKEHPEYQIT